jgi:hypothetical protein
MKIYIDGSKVRTKNLLYNLYLPQEYKFLSKNVLKRKTEISLDELRNECEDSQYIYMYEDDYNLNIKNI